MTENEKSWGDCNRCMQTATVSPEDEVCEFCGCLAPYADYRRGPLMAALAPRDIAILSALDEGSGHPTSHIAQSIDAIEYAMNPSVASRAALAAARSLERRGLVTKLDDLKPICWVRTSSGSAALARAESSS